VLDADSEFALKFKPTGLAIASQTMTLTFSAAGDKATVEFLGEGT
jgi:hypothetical protein